MVGGFRRLGKESFARISFSMELQLHRTRVRVRAHVYVCSFLFGNDNDNVREGGEGSTCQSESRTFAMVRPGPWNNRFLSRDLSGK